MDAKEKLLDREFRRLNLTHAFWPKPWTRANPLLETLEVHRHRQLEPRRVLYGPHRQPESGPIFLYQTIQTQARDLLEKRNAYFLETLVPELAAAGFTRLQPGILHPRPAGIPDELFHKEIFPVLTPIALADDKPLPVLSNLQLHLVVTLAETGQSSVKRYAVVEIPQKVFPRMLFLPAGEKGHPFVLLEDVIASFATEFFPGFEILEKGIMRLTRGAELTLDEEKDEDFLR